jgi:hypothetical protein
MAKLRRPVVYGLLGVVVVAAFVMTSGEPPAASGKKVSTRAKATSAKAGSAFLPEDYEAEFAPVSAPARNSFQPLVTRTKTAAELSLAPDAVPAELAGGDPNWVYTGTAELDGRPMALLENRSTGESEFVYQGQRWKKATVAQILPQGLVLASASGKKVKLTMYDGDMSELPGAQRFANGFQPVNPPLAGPIGNGISVRPDRSARNRDSEVGDAN